MSMSASFPETGDGPSACPVVPSLPVQVVLVAHLNQELAGKLLESLSMRLVKVVLPVSHDPFAKMRRRIFLTAPQRLLPDTFAHCQPFETITVDDGLQQTRA